MKLFFGLDHVWQIWHTTSAQVGAFSSRVLGGVSQAARKANDQPRVQVPKAEELGSILRPLFDENAAERRFFCGADFEEAVNRTYQRCLRSALGDDTWPEDNTRVNVYLTSEELTHSLRDVPKSVTRKLSSSS